MPAIDCTSDEVSKLIMERFIAYFGPPQSLLTDNGSHFVNKLINQFNKLFGITHYQTIAYNARSNGSIERLHFVIKEFVKLYLDKFDNWLEILPIAQYSYNNTKHESTGYKPIEMIIGFQPKTPSSFALLDNPETYTAYTGPCEIISINYEDNTA